MLSVSPLTYHTSKPMSPSIDVDALSGIFGSISIACWVVVFTPQIVENFRRSSADGLSLLFVIIWLAGDVFNILGAVLQGVLPTMTILAVYYTVADLVLLGQCIWYRGWRFGGKELVKAHGGDGKAVESTPATEESPLLASDSAATRTRPQTSDADHPRRASQSSLHSSFSNNVDATHLSPATPFLAPSHPTSTPPAAETLKPRSALWAFLFNTSALVIVCLAGMLGWYLSSRAHYVSKHTPSHHRHDHHSDDHGHEHNYFISSLFLLPSTTHTKSTSSHSIFHNASISDKTNTLHFDLWGQIFGYLCAVLYLGSRLPQLLLNYQRKSTDGVSLLFFLFACVGNLTYVLSIFAYEPGCARVQGAAMAMNSSEAGHGCRGGEWGQEYGRYILMNASWLVGSAGTLGLDFCIFGQFWLYRGGAPQTAA